MSNEPTTPTPPKLDPGIELLLNGLDVSEEAKGIIRTSISKINLVTESILKLEKTAAADGHGTIDRQFMVLFTASLKIIPREVLPKELGLMLCSQAMGLPSSQKLQWLVSFQGVVRAVELMNAEIANENLPKINN